MKKCLIKTTMTKFLSFDLFNFLSKKLWFKILSHEYLNEVPEKNKFSTEKNNTIPSIKHFSTSWLSWMIFSGVFTSLKQTKKILAIFVETQKFWHHRLNHLFLHRVLYSQFFIWWILRKLVFFGLFWGVSNEKLYVCP